MNFFVRVVSNHRVYEIKKLAPTSSAVMASFDLPCCVEDQILESEVSVLWVKLKLNVQREEGGDRCFTSISKSSGGSDI